MDGDKALDYVVRGRRVALPSGVQPACLDIAGGVIRSVLPYETPLTGRQVLDAGDAVVMAGLVDAHVHCNEPGRTEWEGFGPATRAAAAGGVTTLVDMPLNSIPAATSAAALQEKVQAAKTACWVDVGFYGGIIPGNASEIKALHNAGVFGFKCFLCPSGVPEFAAVTASDLDSLMPLLRDLGARTLAHAELPGFLQTVEDTRQTRSYAAYLASRPPIAEHEAISLLIRLCHQYHVPVHIVHLSGGDVLQNLAAARGEGAPLTVETAPHYLYFSAEDIADGATEFKCAPPIRTSVHREQLWQGLHDGVIDFIASDHSPCPPAMKLQESGDFKGSWGGISSLQLSLPVVWTAARERGFGISHIARWMSQAPSEWLGLGSRKGSLEEGKDADLVCWWPDRAFTVCGRDLENRHKLTPYEGHTLFGVVEWTTVHGQPVSAKGRVSAQPYGVLLARTSRVDHHWGRGGKNDCGTL